MIRKTARTAAKTHRCSCGTVIKPGDRHWEMVAVDEDFTSNEWWRLRECADCAERYDRPVPRLLAEEPK